ncbi:MAG: cysteine hydrolase, partial [Gammaproteobacteria bacterium]|nr:cysteine hydrolase [Gammaproteobacteria bacterium]
MKTIGNRAYLTELAEIIDPAHTAVLVIDQQNDFSHPKGYYAEIL